MTWSVNTVKPVASYADDVHVWVYFDQVDRVIRYEAYVIGYDDAGQPTTLEFVIEEGVLDNAHEVPLFAELMRQAESRSAGRTQLRLNTNGQLVATPVLDFYPSLSEAQLNLVHAYFEQCEAQLKEERRQRWTGALRALGFDVLPRL